MRSMVSLRYIEGRSVLWCGNSWYESGIDSCYCRKSYLYVIFLLFGLIRVISFEVIIFISIVVRTSIDLGQYGCI